MSASYIYMLPSDNPFETLALEEALLERAPSGIFLLLYRHRPSVIIGRAQNAWAECCRGKMTRDGVLLARRITGGGAVYHDPQNLNFSFIASPELYDVPRQLRVILKALHGLGIDAEFSGRNDLLAGGRKFSGSAFCVRRGACLHHGTLLIRTDPEKMTAYLTPPPDKLAAKGIASVRSRVVNLADLVPGLTTESAITAVAEAFAAEYGAPRPFQPDDALRGRVSALHRRNAGWEWRYGKTPPFDLALSARFAWGGLDLHLKLEQGKIRDAWAYTDAMDPGMILELPGALRGCLLSGPEMSRSLAVLGNDPRLTDIARFFAVCGY